MLRKLVILVILLTSIIFVFLFFLRNTLGDIRPAIFPPKYLVLPPKVGEPSEVKKQNRVVSTDLPLRIEGDFVLGLFASGLPGPRDLAFSPKGSLLVSSTSEGTVILLSDENKDKISDRQIVILKDLERPHGLAFFGGKLFVAEEESVKRYFWDEEAGEASFEKTILSLPSGGRHYTRSIVFDNLGKLYVSVGSTCDVCFEKDSRNGAVLLSDSEGTTSEVFANGLRNTVFLKINQESGEVWGTEMGRDFLGDNLPPDEVNIIRKGDYGWPVCFGDKVFDKDFNKKAVSCSETIAPVYNIPAHSAPLGLAFIKSAIFPDTWQGDLLVSYHGSWNRTVPTGYKIARLSISDGKVVGESDFISGFLQGSQAIGRPVDLEFDTEGFLYISDDKSGNIYIVGNVADTLPPSN